MLRKLIHRAIVAYLRRCGGAFHHGGYGSLGRYVMCVNEQQYNAYQAVKYQDVRAVRAVELSATEEALRNIVGRLRPQGSIEEADRHEHRRDGAQRVRQGRTVPAPRRTEASANAAGDAVLVFSADSNAGSGVQALEQRFNLHFLETDAIAVEATVGEPIPQ